MNKKQNQPRTSQQVPQQKQLLETEQQTDTTPGSQNIPEVKPRSSGMVKFLRFLVIGGGLFIVFVIGLGVSFSACFTIKGPPPPHCGPVSFVSLILMPGGALFFLIPLAKKIK
jgi:hypothetical protein